MTGGTGARKRIVHLLGNALMLVAIAFIGYKLCRYREDFTRVFTWKIGLVMLVSALATAAIVVISSYFYGNLVGRIARKKVPLGMVSRVYCKSNLYKYIPGNVLQYVGRNQIAEFSDAGHDRVIIASVTEMGMTAVGALLASTILARRFVLDWLRNQNIGLIVGIIVAGIAVLAAICVILSRKRPRVLLELKAILNPGNTLFIAAMLLFIVANQMVNGALFTVLLKSLIGTLPREYWGNIAGVYSFAWLVGFITPGAPGGMGIREALLSMLLASVMSPEMITVAVIMNRIVTVVGDLLAYPASGLIQTLGQSKEVPGKFSGELEGKR